MRHVGGMRLLAMAGLWLLCALPGWGQGHSRPGNKQPLHPSLPPFSRAYGAATLLANLSDTRITESSGLAASRRTPGIFWTHNDSGDGPHLFAIDRAGHTLTRLTLTGATSRDWEDIAMGPDANGNPAIYVGDIGDNSSNRTDTAVYRLTEPSVDTTKTMLETATSQWEKFPYIYPDGSHNAETLLVHPTTGEIFIVTKETSGVSGIYRFPMPLTPGLQVTLEKMGTVTFRWRFLSGNLALASKLATGGDISPDGRKVIARTYLLGYEWDIAPGQSTADAMQGTPRQIMLPITPQGESICYRADGKGILMTSEGVKSPLFEMLAVH